MGRDIWGMVEVFDSMSKRWRGIISIDSLVERYYPIYSALFGGEWQSFLDLTPATTRRGLPADLSWEARQYGLRMDDMGDGLFHGDTVWLLWSEFKAVDPNELGLDYRRNEFCTRSEVLNRDSRWVLLWNLIKVLEAKYSPEHIRLTCWID